MTKDAKDRLVHQRVCQHSPSARRNVRRANRRFRNAHVERKRAAQGGGNPIPGYIVACESGGSYTAVNPDSGAYGKYQILPQHWDGWPNGQPGICRDLSRSPGDQDTCAARIWKSSGPGAWDCA